MVELPALPGAGRLELLVPLVVAEDDAGFGGVVAETEDDKGPDPPEPGVADPV